jgi:hypothetical protein
METIARWNAIDKQVASLLTHGTAATLETPLLANDPKVLGVVLDGLRKLPADDARNVGVDEAAKLLRLGDAQLRQLKAAGAQTLADVATVLQIAPEMERQDAEVARLTALFKEQKSEGTPPDPVNFGITAKDSAAMLESIGKGLAGNHARPPARR